MPLYEQSFSYPRGPVYIFSPVRGIQARHKYYLYASQATAANGITCMNLHESRINILDCVLIATASVALRLEEETAGAGSRLAWCEVDVVSGSPCHSADEARTFLVDPKFNKSLLRPRIVREPFSSMRYGGRRPALSRTGFTGRCSWAPCSGHGERPVRISASSVGSFLGLDS